MPSSEFYRAMRFIHSRLNSLAPAEVESICAQPVFIILSGLPGTGKSTMAREVGRLLPAVVIESDFVRKSLFPTPNYSAEESRLIHAIARAVARQLLRNGQCVISDATNLRERHRILLLRVAEQSGASPLIVHLSAPEQIIRARLQHRFVERPLDDHSDANWAVYELLAADVERIRGHHLRIDTSRDLDASVRRVVGAARHAARRSHTSPP